MAQLPLLAWEALELLKALKALNLLSEPSRN